jgi:nucleotide-binding universal stress UspA family protein
VKLTAEKEESNMQTTDPALRTEKDTQQILICYDGSSGAGHAVDAAAALFGPRRAVVLVVTPPMTFAEGIAATSALVPGTAFEEGNMADALQRAEAGAAHARRSGLHAEARAMIAPTTWEGIVDVAEELDVAVIVMGTRGLSGLREVARGSVSHDVATHARRPVLIVPLPPTNGAA